MEESEQLKIIETIACKPQLIIANNEERDENENKEVIEIKDTVISIEKPPYHPPVHRVMRPKLSRLQRMEAIEGSIKVKKSKKEKESIQKKDEHEVPAHNLITRNASADEKRHSSREIEHQVLRNVNSTDGTYSSKSDKATKSTWTIEIHSPVKLQSILPVKPPQERLLPIGIGVKDSRIHKEILIKEEFGHYNEKVFPGEFDKGVQTFKSLVPSDGEIHYPACERLLPIGPTPPFSRKEALSISPLVQPKRSAIFYSDSRVKDENNVLKQDLSTTLTDTITTTSNTNAIQASAAITYATTASGTSMVATTTVTNAVSPTKLTSGNLEVKVKTSNAPILVGVAKVVKAGEQIETSIGSPKKEIKAKIDDNSKLETNTTKDYIIEKRPLESSVSLGQSIGIEKTDETQTLSLVSIPIATAEEQKPLRQHYRQRKARKIGSTSSDLQRSVEARSGGVADKVSRRAARSIPTKRSGSTQLSGSAIHSAEDIINERCTRCGNVLEQFSEEEIGMCIIILGAYVHRDPSVAAPILPEILRLVSKYAGLTTFGWQNER